MPMGTAVPVAGGYRVSGRWPFASGVRHSEWISTSAMVERPGGPEALKVVIPTASVELHDNWHVVGLKGTGSCDFSANDLFVPSAFTWRLMGGQPKRGGPLYRLAFPGYVANEHAGVALGLARAALDRFVAKETERSRSYVAGSPAMATRPVIQDALARMELKLRAARLLAIDVNEDAWRTLEAGGEVSVQQQCELRAAATYSTEVAVDIVTEAFRHAGGSAIYTQHALQQMLRDINVAAQHRMVSAAAYENLGRALLGVPEVNPMQ
jgi:alkylation response protein AidB-like acyl-CoA dehydrogenase